MQKYCLVIDGVSVPTKEHFEVKNPSTGEVVGLAPSGSVDDVNKAVAAAAKAFVTWRATADKTRADICQKISDVISANSEELALLLTKEQGKPLGGLGSRFELGGAAAWGAHTGALSLPPEVLQDDGQVRLELHRKPLGVVVSITPWNWPLMIAIWHLMPAIRMGNTVVIKPSPLTPLSTIRMVELINEVLPAGVLNVLTGDNAMANVLTSHPDVAKVTFTGSTATGKKVMESATATLKRLTLELGGNDAAILLPDINPAEIAEDLFWGAFVNSGQTCACMKRLYVHNDIYDEVCSQLAKFVNQIPMGDGQDENSVLGPVQNEMQFNKVAELVEDARQNGGQILTGGAPRAGDGYFYPITLIADVADGVRVVDEEQFGPVLPLIRYSDVEDVIKIANRSDFGLGGSVWSGDAERAKELAMRLECGITWVNSHGGLHINAPFGGVKQSGFGREFGEEGLKEFTSAQTVVC
jgi:acyl-CoA reductase-like NAD-dependent aldehyde dehydrogenase